MHLSQRRRFPRSPRSVGAARTFALGILTAWGIVDRLDDIRLCVSELTTNALLHGVPQGRDFELTLSTDGTDLRIAVRDSGDGRPVASTPTTEDCTGRGLYLLRELADDFGVTEHSVGKTVWLTFKALQSAPLDHHACRPRPMDRSPSA
ncbi:ATP-binding protein [Streptomyces durmitorensis]|uniref:ATP-binding protein n=1 Tax=Streptomyces durmitorensis TaxID=319947 RepID=A0ABY4Q8B4_9ACTN|nr:ATP-binding protein [Streptomyces durmitorensis]UQT61645.1 ATP-binding protein [Streptomyces durmitorensis]